MIDYNLSVILEECEKLFSVDKFDELKNKTILITGANGLIGGFLADFFAFLNNKGFNINILLTSYSSSNNCSRVKHLLEDKRISYFSWDCAEPLPANAITEEVDMVFFSAGYGQPSKFLKDSVKTTMLNIVGVKSVLEHLEEKQDKSSKMLFLSTSEIYGAPKQYPTTESYKGEIDFENNRLCYILSKATAESLCLQYDRSKKVKTKIARVALAYGPGTKRTDSRVMQEFIFKAHNNKKIDMLDSGESIRNYLYITDCVEILLNIILKGKEKVYNVGGDTEEVSIFNLAQKISDLTGAYVEKGKKKEYFIKTAPQKVGLSMDRYRAEFCEYGKNIVNLNKGISQVLRWYNIPITEK